MIYASPEAVGLPRSLSTSGSLRPLGPEMGAMSRSRLWASKHLTTEEKRALRDAAGAAFVAAPKKYLARENDDVDKLLIVVSGWACRYTATKEGSSQLLGLILPGDIANLDTLHFSRLHYSVRTLSNVVVTSLSRTKALQLVADHPGIGRAFARLPLVEASILGQWTLSVGQRSMRERLGHLLCELSIRLGAGGGKAFEFECALTQNDFGSILGVSGVHVNRMIQRFRREGLISVRGKSFLIPDVRRLRQISGFDPTYLHLDTDGWAT